MLLTTVNQWQAALYLLCGGVALGVLYDLFRAVRRLLRAGRWVTVMMDVLFCLMALPVLFWLLWSAAAMALRNLDEPDRELRVLADAWTVRNVNSFLAGYAEIDAAHRRNRDRRGRCIEAVEGSAAYAPDWRRLPIVSLTFRF